MTNGNQFFSKESQKLQASIRDEKKMAEMSTL